MYMLKICIKPTTFSRFLLVWFCCLCCFSQARAAVSVVGPSHLIVDKAGLIELPSDTGGELSDFSLSSSTQHIGSIEPDTGVLTATQTGFIEVNAKLSLNGVETLVGPFVFPVLEQIEQPVDFSPIDSDLDNVFLTFDEVLQKAIDNLQLFAFSSEAPSKQDTANLINMLAEVQLKFSLGQHLEAFNLLLDFEDAASAVSLPVTSGFQSFVLFAEPVSATAVLGLLAKEIVALGISAGITAVIASAQSASVLNIDSLTSSSTFSDNKNTVLFRHVTSTGSVNVNDNSHVIIIAENDGKVRINDNSDTVVIADNNNQVSIRNNSDSIYINKNNADGDINVHDNGDTVQVGQNDGNIRIIDNNDTIVVGVNNNMIEIVGNSDTITINENNGVICISGNSDTINIKENNGTVVVCDNDDTVNISINEGDVFVCGDNDVTTVKTGNNVRNDCENGPTECKCCGDNADAQLNVKSAFALNLTSGRDDGVFAACPFPVSVMLQVLGPSPNSFSSGSMQTISASVFFPSTPGLPVSETISFEVLMGDVTFFQGNNPVTGSSLSLMTDLDLKGEADFLVNSPGMVLMRVSADSSPIAGYAVMLAF